MDVRVCGPNLNDQSKGSFHVHADGCRDLRNYGPGGKLGGDQDGMNEMLVKDATVYKVVEATYSDQIDENVSDEQSRMDIAADYANDFWFAPCCADHVPLEGETVYECWIQHKHGSWAKLKSDDKLGLVSWLIDALRGAQMHDHINIVVHRSDEYTS